MNLIIPYASDIVLVLFGCLCIVFGMGCVTSGEVRDKYNVYFSRTVNAMRFWGFLGLLFLFSTAAVFTGLRSLSERVTASRPR